MKYYQNINFIINFLKIFINYYHFHMNFYELLAAMIHKFLKANQNFFFHLIKN